MRSSLRRRERAVLLRSAMSWDVRLEEHAALRDLHRVAGEPHLDLLAAQAVGGSPLRRGKAPSGHAVAATRFVAHHQLAAHRFEAEPEPLSPPRRRHPLAG